MLVLTKSIRLFRTLQAAGVGLLLSSVTAAIPISPVAPAPAAPQDVDVFFLMDATASMSTPIANMQAGLNTVLLPTLGSLPGVDIQYGVGSYRDYPLAGSPPYAFQVETQITSNATLLTIGINSWTAGGGGDSSEGQLLALHELGTDGQGLGQSAGWRPGARKVLVWIGDAPGHDPICSAISGLAYDIHENLALNALLAPASGGTIEVIGIDISNPSQFGLDGDPASGVSDYVGTCSISGVSGQATRITDFTDGTLVSTTAGGLVSVLADTLVNHLCGGSSSEVVRLGSPPNPQAFLAGLTNGPVIGGTWDPVVNPLAAGEFLTFVMVAPPVPINTVAPPLVGTLLCNIPSANLIWFSTPGTAFAINIPNKCTLVGKAKCTQGGSITPGPTIYLANALDITIGTL